MQGLDAGDVVRFVQRGEGNEADQVVENGVVDQRGLGIALATMNDTMADSNDLPAALGGLEPFEQGVEGKVMADLVADNDLIGDFFTVTVLGDQFGDIGTDAVDLA